MKIRIAVTLTENEFTALNAAVNHHLRFLTDNDDDPELGAQRKALSSAWEEISQGWDVS